MKKEIEVVAALIKRGRRFLLCQRKEDDAFGLLWEFPGGKVEEKEPLDYAIEREIKEELGVTIKAEGLLKDFYDEINLTLSTEGSSPKSRKGGARIRVYLFNCCIIEGRLNKKDCHDFGFFTLREIARLKLAPVDRKIFLYLKGHHIMR
jgi:8-oxo-dGTP diphosphatase